MSLSRQYASFCGREKPEARTTQGSRRPSDATMCRMDRSILVATEWRKQRNCPSQFRDFRGEPFRRREHLDPAALELNDAEVGILRPRDVFGQLRHGFPQTALVL